MLALDRFGDEAVVRTHHNVRRWAGMVAISAVVACLLTLAMIGVVAWEFAEQAASRL
jgi:hypothetical protein